MKICLINPRGLDNYELSIPHGLLQISAELNKNGYSCKILDFSDPIVKISYDELNKFDVVGFSVMTTQLRHAVEIASRLNKNVKVVWGGTHCLLDPASILNKYREHFVISGDGEGTLLKLLEYFSENKDFDFIKCQEGISCYSGRPIINPPSFISDLNELENINYYDLPNLDRYINKPFGFFKTPNNISMLRILISRGCTWNCNFCINSIYRQHKAFHRTKNIVKIRAETEKIIDDFNIKLVLPQDEDFFINKIFVEEWKNYAKEKGFFWGADCRYNYFRENMIDEDRLKTLIEAGLFFVGMSIEAGQEHLRNKLLNKQLKDNEIYNTAGMIKRSVGKRLLVNTSFIVNFPGDTVANKIETIKWMDYLSRNLNIVFTGPQVYRPYPGSRLYDLEKNRKNGDINYYINNVSSSGTFRTSKIMHFESLFYSNLLIRYFNSRFKLFEIEKNGSKVLKLKITNKKSLRIENMLLSIVFLPVRFRLKFGYWGLFFEPFFMGFLFSPLQKIKKIFRRRKV